MAIEACARDAHSLPDAMQAVSRRLIDVTAAAKKVLEEALALPERDRADLIDALATSLDGQAEVDEAWRIEILRRVEQVRTGSVELESPEDVRRAGREALARR